jgi:hypothetical protein
MPKRRRSRSSSPAGAAGGFARRRADREKVQPRRAKKVRVSRDKRAATSSASAPSLEELLAFERLLSDLSARFANVAVDQVVAEIEAALERLLKFLGFDRSAFAEVIDGDRQCILCSAAAEGVKAPLRGPIPAHFNWFTGQLLSGRTVVIRSHEDIPPQPNTIVALVFAPSFSFRCLLVVVSSPRSALARSARPDNGQTNSSRACGSLGK